MHHIRRSSLSLQWDSPRHWSYSISPLDSDSAPLLKRCEGHLAGSPVSGELLLSGGGASQQARGGGQVCLMHVFGVSGLTCCLLLVSPALKLLADHPQLSHKCRLVQTCIRKCRRLKKNLHKHGQGWPAGTCCSLFSGLFPIQSEDWESLCRAMQGRRHSDFQYLVDTIV